MMETEIINAKHKINGYIVALKETEDCKEEPLVKEGREFVIQQMNTMIDACNKLIKAREKFILHVVSLGDMAAE